MSEKTPSPTSARRSAILTNDLLSSPPRRKERRNPSITPRKFERFFTPRSRVSSKPSAVRKALRDLTAPALNRCQTPSSPLRPISEEQTPNGLPRLQQDDHQGKRRKLHHTPEKQQSCHLPSPLKSSPAVLSTTELSPALRSPIHSLESRRLLQEETSGHDGLSDEDEEEAGQATPTSKRPVPLHSRGLGGQLVQRMTGRMACPVSDWRIETADFYSRPEDVHFSSGHDGAPRAIPFCTATCHKNSLVAVGDEEGYVRLLDSSRDFSKIHLSFQAHGNAIIDLAFSDHDYLLATASGDQTGRVIDMMTQKPISILGHHTASLKQVRFQPGRGSGCVLATSGRDGSVQIWDLRCRGGPVQDIMPIVSEAGLHHRLPKPTSPGCVVNSIYDAHARALRQTRSQLATTSADVARMGEVPGRIGEVSVTAVQFLPPGREHLLLTACEADASIKLWDIRAVHTSRHHKTSTPISFTAPPASHVAFRPFGICSMTLGGDGARLYALCKDNTVYAYSTAHLVLGHASELTPARAGADPPRRRHHPHGTAHEGLGPLYGFRHPLFHATSFYVKASIRPCADGRSELLAVGSGDGCAVLFPTDERYLRDAWAVARSSEAQETYYVGAPTDTTATHVPPAAPPPSLARSNSGGFGGIFAARQADLNVPLARRGTPLVRGHGKEVGAVAWTSDGKLITVGDDYLVRCWSEDREAAADLRLGGEAEGRRWGRGWADVGDAWDGDRDDC